MAWLTPGSAPLGLEALDAMRRAKKAMKDKPTSSIPSWPLYPFLPPGFCPDYLE